MASFIDLVAESIYLRREEFLAGLSSEPDTEIEHFLSIGIQAHWHPLVPGYTVSAHQPPPLVGAVDGSRAVRALNIGADWIVAQALLVGPNGFRKPAIDTRLLRGEIEHRWTLREVWKRAIIGQLHHPIFIVLEEAHNLIPANSQTRASRIINAVAAEGRKFRVFLPLITQRPSKISQDALSQCGSQMIIQLTNPDDQRAVQRASEAISAELLDDLPGLNKGEAIVLGQLTRIPVMVRISGRASAEGGSDVDIVVELRRAKQDVNASRMAEKFKSQAVVPHQQEEW